MVRAESDRVQSITSRARTTETKARLWVHDEWTTFDVVAVPVDALLLNVDNRRFRAERLWVEEMLGRSLDPENRPEDERCVESLLLDIAHRVANGLIEGRPSDAYESLKNDWLRRSQETPFWIRPDGTVRNGNRRLAMIQRLQREGGDSGLQWVNAVILDPGGIDEAALLEMEQREQLTENFKVRYNDIDYLLALREAAEIRDIDWFDQDSIDQVSGELQTMVEKSNREVERDLYAIKYMDLFLEDSEKPGQYHRLLRQLEVFRDIGRMMITIEADYPTDYDRVLQVLFATVRAGKKYQDVRQIRQMFFKSRSRFEALADLVVEIESDLGTEQKPTLNTPALTGPEPSSEDEEDLEEPAVDVSDYPKGAVGTAIDVAIDGYAASKRGDVLMILSEVLNRLAVLDGPSGIAAALAEPSEQAAKIRDALSGVVSWAEEHRDLLADHD